MFLPSVVENPAVRFPRENMPAMDTANAEDMFRVFGFNRFEAFRLGIFNLNLFPDSVDILSADSLSMPHFDLALSC